MKIYTKTGDKGETSLFGGKRIFKNDLQVEAYGTVDELMSYVGLLASYTINLSYQNLLKEVQDRLFTIGSHLASDPLKTKLKKPDLLPSDVILLENSIDEWNEGLTPLKHFILPGGHKEVAFAHIARTVCRRAERTVVALNQLHEQPELIIEYLNRLSDFLFVFSRVMAKNLSAEEVIWEPRILKEK